MKFLKNGVKTTTKFGEKTNFTRMTELVNKLRRRHDFDAETLYRMRRTHERKRYDRNGNIW